MFGFVNANPKSLSEEERAVYQAFYCGLCRELKKRGGQKCEILLNYDSVFLALLLSGLYEPPENSFSFKCAVHPLKTREAYENEFISYAADIDIILSYESLKDRVHEGGALAYKKLLSSLEKIYGSSAGKYEDKAKAAALCVEKTTEAEEKKVSDIDVLSSFTGEMLGGCFVRKKDEFSEKLFSCGFYLGKYIYLLDAYYDYLSDRKKHRFNPLLLMGFSNMAEMTEFTEPLLTTYISECVNAFEMLPVLTYSGIIRNILYSGVWSRFNIAKKRYLSKEQKK